MAQRDEQVGTMAAQHLPGERFVRRVGIRVEQTDRYRFDAERGQRLSQSPHRCFIERGQYLAGGVHALGQFEGQLPRYQRPRPVEEQIEGVGPVAPPDGVDIAKTKRRDQRGPGAASFQYRVDGDGRAVQQLGHGRDIALRDAQRLSHTRGRIGGHRRAFRSDDGAVPKTHEVGEGATDIDTDDAQAALCWACRSNISSCRA